MSDFSFEELRNIHRREKKETGLSELDENFYKKLALLIKELKENYKTNPNPENLRELENINKLANDLFFLREQKLVLKALRSVRTSKKKRENLTPEEERVFTSIVKILEQNRKFFESVIEGVYPEGKSTEPTKEIPKTILNFLKTNQRLMK